MAGPGGDILWHFLAVIETVPKKGNTQQCRTRARRIHNYFSFLTISFDFYPDTFRLVCGSSNVLLRSLCHVDSTYELLLADGRLDVSFVLYRVFLAVLFAHDEMDLMDTIDRAGICLRITSRVALALLTTKWETLMI